MSKQSKKNYYCLAKFGKKYKNYDQNIIIRNMKQFINKTNVNEDDIIKNKNLLVKVISADAGMGKSFLTFLKLKSYQYIPI